MDGGVGGSWKVNKITPETYEKMNEEFEEEGFETSELSSLLKNKLMTGSKETKLNIAKNLVEKIEELLDGKAHYVECSDRTTYHNKIVIEYNHTNK